MRSRRRNGQEGSMCLNLGEERLKCLEETTVGRMNMIENPGEGYDQGNRPRRRRPIEDYMEPEYRPYNSIPTWYDGDEVLSTNGSSLYEVDSKKLVEAKNEAILLKLASQLEALSKRIDGMTNNPCMTLARNCEICGGAHTTEECKAVEESSEEMLARLLQGQSQLQAQFESRFVQLEAKIDARFALVEASNKASDIQLDQLQKALQEPPLLTNDVVLEEENSKESDVQEIEEDKCEEEDFEIQVDVQENGGKEQFQNSSLEEEYNENEVDITHDLNDELLSMDNKLLGDDFRTFWEPGDIGGLESCGPHWPIFISNDSHFLIVHEDDPRLSMLVDEKKVEERKKKSQEEEKGVEKGDGQCQEYHLDGMIRKKFFLNWVIEKDEGIVLDMGECDALQDDKKDLSLTEFVDEHHLKKYLDERIDGKIGILLHQSFDG